MTRFLDNALDHWSHSPGALRLGSALLHFVWQGALLAALALVMLVVLKRARPQLRYLTLLVLLTAMAASPLITFVLVDAEVATAPFASKSQPTRDAPQVALTDDSAMAEPPPIPPNLEKANEGSAASDKDALATRIAAADPTWSAPVAQVRNWLQYHRHWLVAAWLAGVCLLSLRLAMGLAGAHRARCHGISEAALPVQQAVARLAQQLGIPSAVCVAQSALAEVPTLVGWLRPMILLPASALSGLSTAELEAILAHELAHELAHVRRHDYLVNLLQTVIETVLFYRPAVWWLSRRIRQEREHCCDDMAIAICCDRLVYARALTTLEERRPSPRWAIAARGGSLLTRILRIVGKPQPADGGKLALIAIAAVLTLVVGLALPRPAQLIGQEQATAPPAKKPETESQKDNVSTTSAPAAARREYPVRVVNTKGDPVVNAKVTPYYIGYTYAGFKLGDLDLGSLEGYKQHGADAGSMIVDERLLPSVKVPLQTDARGEVIVDLTPDSGSTFDKILQKMIVTRIGLTIDHPDHPRWQGTVNVIPEGPVVLPDSTAVEIRARRDGEQVATQNLYPIFGDEDISSDVSQADGLLTIRRVDLAAPPGERWLRIVQLPSDEAPRFTAAIDLKKYHTNPITLDVALKPGTRVSGRLSDNVRRPVAHGRVLAFMVRGSEYRTRWEWGDTTEIAPDGTFEFPSLPPDENLQLIALCDGWVSSSPSLAAVQSFNAEHGFPGDEKTRFYRGPMRDAVHPQLYRLTSETLQSVIPMEPTLSCEVTILDQNEQPIEGASVFFQPNQRWFNGGSQHLGYEFDSLGDIRRRLAKEEVSPAWKRDGGANSRLSQKTDARGIALISNLPAGSLEEPATQYEFRFSVGLKGYTVVKDKPPTNAPFEMLSAKVPPGQTGKVTVHMRRQ
jgi:beta-lactamase regulating signal transducer with metallopeptidase domain